MKLTRKLLVISSLLLVSGAAFGQNFNTTEPLIILNSQALRDVYKEVQGSPFLFDKWSKGSITTKQNVKEDVNLLYNEVEDRILLKVQEGEADNFVDRIDAFTIVDKENGSALRKFKSGFLPTKYSSEKTFFEVLIDGKARLLKKNEKVIAENREYSGKIARTVVDNTNYYIALGDNVPVKVKANDQSVAKLLDFQNNQIAQYIKSNKPNLKQEDDLVKLITYYNSL